MKNDEGIKLYLNGDKNDKIYIFSQYGSINITRKEYFDIEDFHTDQKVKRYIYRNRHSRKIQYLILEQDIISDFYGAFIYMSNEEL